jgi:hypothetical protein
VHPRRVSDFLEDLEGAPVELAGPLRFLVVPQGNAQHVLGQGLVAGVVDLLEQLQAPLQGADRTFGCPARVAKSRAH